MPLPFTTGYSTSHSAGISYTYYRYFKNSRKWGWFANGSLGISRISVYEKERGGTIMNNRYSQRELSLTPGIFFKPSGRVMLFASIGGISLRNDKYEFTSVHSSFANQLNIGIRINIGNTGRKKNRN